MSDAKQILNDICDKLINQQRHDEQVRLYLKRKNNEKVVSDNDFIGGNY